MKNIKIVLLVNIIFMIIESSKIGNYISYLLYF